MPTVNTIEDRLTSDQFTAAEVAAGQWELTPNDTQWPKRICVSPTAPASFLFSRQEIVPDPEPEPETDEQKKSRLIATLRGQLDNKRAAAKGTKFTIRNGLSLSFFESTVSQLQQLTLMAQQGLWSSGVRVVKDIDNTSQFLQLTDLQLAAATQYQLRAAAIWEWVSEQELKIHEAEAATVAEVEALEITDFE